MGLENVNCLSGELKPRGDPCSLTADWAADVPLRGRRLLPCLQACGPACALAGRKQTRSFRRVSPRPRRSVAKVRRPRTDGVGEKRGAVGNRADACLSYLRRPPHAGYLTRPGLAPVSARAKGITFWDWAWPWRLWIDRNYALTPRSAIGKPRLSGPTRTVLARPLWGPRPRRDGQRAPAVGEHLTLRLLFLSSLCSFEVITGLELATLRCRIACSSERAGQAPESHIRFRKLLVCSGSH